MRFFIQITDDWPDCPGTIVMGPFSTRAQAQEYLNEELAATSKAFVSGLQGFKGEIIEQ